MEGVVNASAVGIASSRKQEPEPSRVPGNMVGNPNMSSPMHIFLRISSSSSRCCEWIRSECEYPSIFCRTMSTVGKHDEQCHPASPNIASVRYLNRATRSLSGNLPITLTVDRRVNSG